MNLPVVDKIVHAVHHVARFLLLLLDSRDAVGQASHVAVDRVGAVAHQRERVVPTNRFVEVQGVDPDSTSNRSETTLEI